MEEAGLVVAVRPGPRGEPREMLRPRAPTVRSRRHAGRAGTTGAGGGADGGGGAGGEDAGEEEALRTGPLQELAGMWLAL